MSTFFYMNYLCTRHILSGEDPERRSLHTRNPWIAYFVPQEVSMCLNNPSSTFRSVSLSEVDASEYHCTISS